MVLVVVVVEIVVLVVVLVELVVMVVEFNFSQNPPITSGSTANSSSIGTFFTPGQYLLPFATSSYFQPYVTTVGLYNEQQQLLAIGKLSQPLPLSPTTDTKLS